MTSRLKRVEVTEQANPTTPTGLHLCSHFLYCHRMATAKLNEVLTFPTAKDHPIKEAVISIFFDRPVEGFEDFPSFYTQNLKKQFPSLEIVPRNESEITIHPDRENLGNRSRAPVGYRAYSGTTDGGQAKYILQLANEEERQYLSIHCLEYDDWHTFSQQFKTYVKLLMNFVKARVSAFSLHYIDELLFPSSEHIPVDQIFQESSNLLPKEIRQSQNSYLVFNSEKLLSEAPPHSVFDRISIKVFSPSVLISHNSLTEVPDQPTINEFLEDRHQLAKLDHAHDHNKTLLRDILSTDVQQQIGL